MDEYLAQTAWKAFAKAYEDRGVPMVSWDRLPVRMKTAWLAAVSEILNTLEVQDDYDD